jgi:hypothetical protein
MRFLSFYSVYLVLLTSYIISAPAQSRLQPRNLNSHERLWQSSDAEQDSSGNSHTNIHSYIEVATGLNRLDPTTQQWVNSDPLIEIDTINGGGIARRAQHSLHLNANANDTNGVVDLQMPDGNQLRLQCIGLALTDNTNSVFIAEIKDTIGQIVGNNSVVWVNAFDSVQADIQIDMKIGSIEHNVILKERLTRDFVQSYGLDPATTRFQVWHQVLTAPAATKRIDFIRRASGMVEEDDTVHFGRMALGKGFAFQHRANQDQSDEPPGLIAVAKEWAHLEGLDFLIESIPFTELESNLQDLPVLEVRADRKNANRALASAKTTTGARKRPVSLAKNSRSPSRRDVLIAALNPASAPKPRGFVIDYQIQNTTQTNFVWQGNMTYFVNGTVSLWGNTVLEPGCTIKFTNYNTVNVPQIIVNEGFDCRTLPWAPGIFTAKDDDTVGEIISGSTASPSGYYALFPLLFSSSATPFDLHDFQVRYCNVGIGSYRVSNQNNVSNGQIYKCDRGLETLQGNLNARNILLYKTRYAVNTSNTASNSIVAEHLTVDSAEKLLLTVATNSCYLYITNSLVCNVTNDTSAHIYSNYVQNVTPTAFKTVGYGYHYLPDSSPYRDIGTPNISPATLAILKQTTTFSPILLTNDFTTDTILSPAIQRDSDFYPDLGYHYPAVDYLWSWLNVTNATLILTNGVSIANYGLLGTLLINGSKLYSTGTPDRMNTIARYETFQEVPTLGWSTNTSGLNFFYVQSSTSDPEVQFRFTRGGFPAYSIPNRRFVWCNWGTDIMSNFSIKDCQLANCYMYFAAQVSGSAMGLDFLNNLFERGNLVFYQTNAGYYAFPLNFRNNYMHGGSMDLPHNSSDPWTFTDNLFDSMNTSFGSFPLSASNNAYRATTTFGGSGNKTLTTLDFQSGPAGPYYYPTAGANLATLINTGSRTADLAGLYHFTTQTNQQKEAATQVDIGFHYVALDTSGATPQPIDSDGDGIPDYVEDKSGNGTADSGESDWNNSNSGRATNPNGLMIFTPWKP